MDCKSQALSPRPVCLISWGHRGGPRILRELSAAWHQLHPSEICLSYNAHGELAGTPSMPPVSSLPVITFGRSRHSALLNLPRLAVLGVQLWRFLKLTQVQTIVAVMPSIYELLLFATALPRDVRLIVFIHDATRHPGEESVALDWLSRRVVRRADRVVTLSGSVTRQLVTERHVAPEKILTAGHPAWTVSESNAPQPRSVPTGRPITVGFFGRILPYKGLHLLIDAVALLQARGYPVRLSVYGSGDDSKELCHAIQAIGDFHSGWLPESHIESVIDQFDILALPYVEASQSGIFAHAIAVGVPVVATPVGGLEEQVATSQAGLIATTVSPEAIADAIQFLIDHPSAYLAASHNGLQAVSEGWTWTKLTNAIRGLSLDYICDNPTK